MPLPRTIKPSSGHGGDAISHEMCWAKTTADGQPGISVRDHCLNVGCVAEALVSLLPAHVRDLLPPGAVTLAALHDIGKVSPGFQAKCDAWRAQHSVLPQHVNGCEADHAKISQFTLQCLFLREGLRFWAAVVGAHHGRIKGDRVNTITETNHVAWDAERRRLACELCDVFGALPMDDGHDPNWWTTAGLITVADWIGSDEEKFYQTWTGDITRRRQGGQAALRSMHWELPVPRHGLDFEELFPSYSVNELQAAAWNHIVEPGLYVIEGPMGCGKTEAALAAAYRLIARGKASGIYFALPTQVTSNRIHLRVQPFLDHMLAQPAEHRLIHSTSWLREQPPLAGLRASSRGDGEASEHVMAGRSWFSSAKRAILAPFGVGTVDQALLGIVAAKHFFVRQFGLAGKVVILDEVHTYDLYTSTLIDVLIRRLLELRCTVIVLSATLTRDRRRELLELSGGKDEELTEAYPLLSCGGTTIREYPVEPPLSKRVTVHFPNPESLVESALDRARQGQCVLWIRNTVDESQQTFGSLKTANHEGGPAIALLHSRFPLFRREELEGDWMERLDKAGKTRPRNGCVLVSTQVVEQSVDIDADLLITDLAPTDMLLQRLGRLHRHDRPDRPGNGPEVWIPAMSIPVADSTKANREALGKSAYVYAPYVLLRSWQQWRSRQAINLPSDIRAILEATYAPPSPDEPAAWADLRENLEQHKAKLNNEALNATKIWHQPQLKDDEGVQTRYSTYPTSSLLLVRSVEPLNSVAARLGFPNGDTVTASGREWNIETARGIHRNLVRMPRWSVKSGLGSEPDWLRKHVVQPTAIGMLLDNGQITFLGYDNPTGLSYCRDRGVLIAPRPQMSKPTLEELHDEDESYD